MAVNNRVCGTCLLAGGTRSSGARARQSSPTIDERLALLQLQAIRERELQDLRTSLALKTRVNPPRPGAQPGNRSSVGPPARAASLPVNRAAAVAKPAKAMSPSVSVKSLPLKSPKSTVAANITAAALQRRPLSGVAAAARSKSLPAKGPAGALVPATLNHTAPPFAPSSGGSEPSKRGQQLANNRKGGLADSAAAVAAAHQRTSELQQLLQAAKQRPSSLQSTALAALDTGDLHGMRNALDVYVEQQQCMAEAQVLQEAAARLKRRWDAACAAERHVTGGSDAASVDSGVLQPQPKRLAPLAKRDLGQDGSLPGPSERPKKRQHVVSAVAQDQSSLLPLPTSQLPIAGAAQSRSAAVLQPETASQLGKQTQNLQQASTANVPSSYAMLVNADVTPTSMLDALRSTSQCAAPAVSSAARPKPLDSNGDTAADAAFSSKYTSPLLNFRSYSSGATVRSCASGIDPEWPMCMFELRGACMNPRCNSQHWSDAGMKAGGPQQALRPQAASGAQAARLSSRTVGKEQRLAAVQGIQPPSYTVQNSAHQETERVLGLGIPRSTRPSSSLLLAPTTTFGVKSYDHYACKPVHALAAAPAPPAARDSRAGRYFSSGVKQAGATTAPSSGSVDPIDSALPSIPLEEIIERAQDLLSSASPGGAQAARLLLYKARQQHPQDAMLLVAHTSALAHAAANSNDALSCVLEALKTAPDCYQLWLLAIAYQPNVHEQANLLLR